MDPALLPDQDNRTVTSQEVSEILGEMRAKLQLRREILDFDDETMMNNDDYVRLTGKSSLQ